jgi:hypothetical protein
MEHEPILQMASDRTILRYATTNNLWSSSLTSVSGRMGSNQILYAAWSVTQTGPTPLKALVLAFVDEA